MPNSKIPPDMLNMFTDLFKIKRNGSNIAAVHGFFCGTDTPKTIQIVEPADIQSGDWLLHMPTFKRYYIKGLEPNLSNGEILEWTVEYLDEDETSGYTVPADTPMGQLQALIEQKPTGEQLILNKLADRISAMIEENQPICSGSFSGFTGIFQRHPDISDAVWEIIRNWLLSTNENL